MTGCRLRRQAVELLARQVAERILEGTVSPEGGAKDIWDLTVHIAPAEFIPEFDTFIYGASEWDERPQDRPAFTEGILAAAHDLLNHRPAE